MSTDRSNSCNNILHEVTSKPTNENMVKDTSKSTNDKEQDQRIETADHEHVMDETVADTDFKEQVKVAVDEQVHVVENKQVVLNNEQVEDLAEEEVDVMEQGLDADQVGGDEQIQEVVDAEQIEMMGKDEGTNEQPIISENQENFTGSGESDDDEQDSAAMLPPPHDQQPAVESSLPQEAFETGVGAGSSTPVTPGYSSSPSLPIESALAGPSSPFSSTAVDYAPAAKDFMKYILNSEQIPMSLILGNNQQSSVPLPSGIQQANHQHFQQMPIFQQKMASEDNRSNRMIFPSDDQVPLRSFESGGASGYANATNNIPVPQLDNGNGGSPYMRTHAIATMNHPQQPMQLLQPATLFGSPEIQFHGLMANQTAAASNGSFPSAGYQNIAIQQGMPSNFMNGNAYGQAGELQRPAAMIPMNNWQGSTNFPAPNYSNSAPAPPPRVIKNSLYDPMYEAMGLPIDPHLRMFLAQQRRENGGNDKP